MAHHEGYDAPELRVFDGLHPIGSEQIVYKSHKPDEATSWGTPVQNQGMDAPKLKKWRTRLVIAGVLALGVILGGAIIGGAVGGTTAARKKTDTVTTTIASYSATSPSSTGSSTVSSTVSVPTGTLEVTTDCPSSNGTTHSPLATVGTPGQYTFVKHCGFDTASGSILAGAFVPSFDDCIDMCSDFNYDGQSGAACFAVTFRVGHTRPVNCWAKSSGTSLVPSAGAASALRQ